MNILSESPHLFKTFLACPISGYMQGDQLVLPDRFERFIRKIYQMLREESDETFLALERERWGDELMQGNVCTPLDFQEMRRCDMVIAYPGTSCGVAVELGWASALGKPIVLLLETASDYTPMIRELGRLPGARVDIVWLDTVEGFPWLQDLAPLRQLVCSARKQWHQGQFVDTGTSENRLAFHSHGMLGTWLIGREEQEAAQEVLRSRSLFRHYGPDMLHKTDAFEAAVGHCIGSRHVLAVSSGTAALRCAMQALKLRKGDEVILPACTFVATANAVLLAGGIPVFAEVDASLGLDPDRLRELVTDKTAGIIAVHLQGQVCAIDRIAAFAEAQGLWLIEDAAQAFGCSLRGKMAGSFGDIGVFSLQAHKTITCGEGGLLVTDNPALYERARQYQDQGGIRQGDSYPSWDHPDAGFGENLKMTEIQAAIALAQLERLPKIKSAMQTAFAEVEHACAEHWQVRHRFDPAGEIPYSLVFFAEDEQERDHLIANFNSAGIPADSAYSEPIYQMSPFVRWSQGDAVQGLPDFDLSPPFFPARPDTESRLKKMIRVPLGPKFANREFELIRSVLADSALRLVS